ncbi:galactose mutarotase [Oceanobacillus piezotolerans]|uniref:Aldose 1-epimerase n=1 Tax=Oceanobacillus piezotolerans TaxID=2448030 RepID=A0A498D4R9_9BACI|nr:aldose epimerase family protein [Oceanobacillus piezotolerans]RLL43836.1 galactose mutarotase [Oceanobacillus piezotolerans]
MEIVKEKIYGQWKEFTLINDKNMSVSVLNYGGIITRILVPDRNGKVENMVLSYKNYQDYKANPHYFGAIIGRVAGRIQDAAFEIDGKTYSLEANDGDHHLHGGQAGLHRVIWSVATFETKETIGLTLTHESKEAEGYPGNVKIIVTYTLTNDNELFLNYTATSDKTTPIALTNHTYFNLSGDLKHTIHDHFLTIKSSNFAELNEELIPTGNLKAVGGSSFDFRNGQLIREGLNEKSKHNRIASGYDHYFIFDDVKDEEQVVMAEPNNGRILTVTTNQPGMVMYTANGLEDGLELRENTSRRHLGVCFETQGSPASLHHKGFPTILLKPGDLYQHQTVFAFRVKEKAVNP